MCLGVCGLVFLDVDEKLPQPTLLEKADLFPGVGFGVRGLGFRGSGFTFGGFGFLVVEANLF